MSESEVKALVGMNEFDQYVSWMACVRRLRLPERVRVVTEPGPEASLVYLRSSSPLAVRSLLGKITTHPRALEFIEDHGDPRDWLITDAQGRHYATELVLSWRDPVYWRAVFGEDGALEEPCI
jgi:hypothetical protein